ncbi:chondroitin proteoglycan 2-like [Haliotis rubra]|uniref:chondroitin proteoglycan 2-like n=1 Tax=Haliotis rubra TaxID=36100 RepID=UPI001EE63004|nr:chondroitin proteoglycan 2-like [Haliotis rubra]
MQQLVVILLVLPAALCLNCTGKADGNYDIGCRSYSTCTAGSYQIVSCPDTQVYNSKIGKCDRPENVAPPCGAQKDCSSKKDGHYADMSNNCISYFTCAAGAFFGHNLCPAGTVFDEDMQTCNWANAVKPPCGTYSPTTAKSSQ